MSGERIIQIIPATGWNSIYAIKQEGSGEWEAEAVPVACFALVENERGHRLVVGMNGAECISRADYPVNLLAYALATDDVSSFDNDARQYGQDEEKWNAEHNASNRPRPRVA